MNSTQQHAEPLEPSAEEKEAVFKLVAAVLNEPGFDLALDRLASDVGELIAEFVRDHVSTLDRHLPADQVRRFDYITSAIVGWCLGSDSEGYADEAARMTRLQLRVLVAGYIAGYAGGAFADQRKGEVH